ncbi:hypothetical protein D3273_27150 [Lichenibacterium minor]|uniref:Uncharacterized protein n=1 Tax=Lichenibacterium minor TaxID=2316528 RepID=A0A4V1RTU2_9HYPH|nr:hypothetical protein [Lichenibacterium minor]RYC28844.1 hypothetical protein D3273_27150 [Lichenibacterium minor]
MTGFSAVLWVLVGLYSTVLLCGLVFAVVQRRTPMMGCVTLIGALPILFIIATYSMAARHVERCSAEAEARQAAGLPPIVHHGKPRGGAC